MKVKSYKRLARWLIVLFIVVGSFLPIYTIQEVAQAEKGRFQFQLDRIEENREKVITKETELDKLFPELFDPEVAVRVQESQKANYKDREKLLKELFTQEKYEDHTVREVKSSLFQDDYEALPIKEEDKDGLDIKSSNLLKWTFMIVTIGIIGMLMFFLMRYMFNFLKVNRG